ncbi:MAG TPA: acyl-ACP--UDP-N-acetylglucosamine O-acyltransferase [Saprospiraceae bacterium]|nr:acyl-[acyl-carrier-protein]--UDP-N-acetylglucosamine O-acyltransferase [Saprospirales bacterium]HRQ30230.1 acyl-ACP--UDP-N-acetylglucosamine O-acyltransferase [Saprospiraceae bacterium]
MNTTSFVHPDAKIGHKVEIGPLCFIAGNVEIGANTIIYPGVTILDGSKIGENCRIFTGAVIGAEAQDLSYAGEETWVEVGNFVTIREFVTLHRGTKVKKKTVIGDHCYLMAYAHVAHDCQVGHHCIFANGVNLAGHVEVGNFVNFGGLSAVHQFCKIGSHAMIGGGSIVRRDVPPFIKAVRNPVAYGGVNKIGLSRKGFSRESIDSITDIYRYLFVKNTNLSKGISEMQANIPESEYKKEIEAFIGGSNRGLIKGL